MPGCVLWSAAVLQLFVRHLRGCYSADEGIRGFKKEDSSI